MACVYFIRSGDFGPIKIGHTAGDPVRRLRELQTAAPAELSLLERMAFGSADQAREGEKRIHGMFASDRIRGEWFFPSPRLVSLIRHIPLGEAVGAETEAEELLAETTYDAE